MYKWEYFLLDRSPFIMLGVLFHYPGKKSHSGEIFLFLFLFFWWRTSLRIRLCWLLVRKGMVVGIWSVTGESYAYHLIRAPRHHVWQFCSSLLCILPAPAARGWTGRVREEESVRGLRHFLSTQMAHGARRNHHHAVRPLLPFQMGLAQIRLSVECCSEEKLSYPIVCHKQSWSSYGNRHVVAAAIMFVVMVVVDTVFIILFIIVVPVTVEN